MVSLTVMAGSHLVKIYNLALKQGAVSVRICEGGYAMPSQYPYLYLSSIVCEFVTDV